MTINPARNPVMAGGSNQNEWALVPHSVAHVITTNEPFYSTGINGTSSAVPAQTEAGALASEAAHWTIPLSGSYNIVLKPFLRHDSAVDDTWGWFVVVGVRQMTFPNRSTLVKPNANRWHRDILFEVHCQAGAAILSTIDGNSDFVPAVTGTQEWAGCDNLVIAWNGLPLEPVVIGGHALDAAALRFDKNSYQFLEIYPMLEVPDTGDGAAVSQAGSAADAMSMLYTEF